VPASSDTIGVCDRVFTRVGAERHLAGASQLHGGDGETSAIMHTATSRSLVLLDEIGRARHVRRRIDRVAVSGISRASGLQDDLRTHYHELVRSRR